MQEGEIQDPDPGAAEGTASTSQTEAEATAAAVATAAATAAVAASAASAAGGSGSGGQPPLQPLQNQQQQAVIMAPGDPKSPAGNEIMNIPLYSGSKKEDPEIWLDCVDNAMSTFNWKPDGKIGAATLRLTGSALTWLRAQRTGNIIYGTGDGKIDYAQFKKDFLARFRPLDDPLRSTEAMKDLHMMDGESINEFKDRVMIAIEKKNYTYDDKTTGEYKTVRDTDAYRSITIGMTGQLRRCLMSGSDPPKELEALMKQAVQAEAALRKTAALPGMAGIMEVTGEQNPDPQPSEEKESEPAGAAGINGSVQEMINELKKLKKQFQCYGCKEYGHIRRDCPNENKQQQQPPQQPQPGAGRGWAPRGGEGWNSRGGYSRG